MTPDSNLNWYASLVCDSLKDKFRGQQRDSKLAPRRGYFRAIKVPTSNGWAELKHEYLQGGTHTESVSAYGVYQVDLMASLAHSLSAMVLGKSESVTAIDGSQGVPTAFPPPTRSEDRD